MAKALGTTAEEEHRLGLSKLATVRFLRSKFLLSLLTNIDLANQRTSRAIFHGHEPARSNRLVRRLPAGGLRSCREHGDADGDTTSRADHEALFGPARAVSAQ
jgi:hypothetical protein